MSGFFGIIMSSLQPGISSKSLSVRSNASTSSINVSSTANNRVKRLLSQDLHIYSLLRFTLLMMEMVVWHVIFQKE